MRDLLDLWEGVTERERRRFAEKLPGEFADRKTLLAIVPMSLPVPAVLSFATILFFGYTEHLRFDSLDLVDSRILFTLYNGSCSGKRLVRHGEAKRKSLT